MEAKDIPANEEGHLAAAAHPQQMSVPQLLSYLRSTCSLSTAITKAGNYAVGDPSKQISCALRHPRCCHWRKEPSRIFDWLLALRTRSLIFASPLPTSQPQLNQRTMQNLSMIATPACTLTQDRNEFETFSAEQLHMLKRARASFQNKSASSIVGLLPLTRISSKEFSMLNEILLTSLHFKYQNIRFK